MVLWQDHVFLIGSFVTAIVLIPTLRDPKSTLPILTSGPTSVILLVYSFTYFTLELYLSAFGAFVTGLMWTAILVYRRSEDATIQSELHDLKTSIVGLITR